MSAGSAEPAADAAAPAAYPDRLRERVERALEELRFDDDGRAAGLVEAMRYSLLAGGKRVRPVLCCATAEALGVRAESALPAALAIELIHTYSLIHDDLPAIDDDALRRGRPTCHIQFGEAVAILAGDALFAEAYRLVIQAGEWEAERKLAVLGEIAAATGVAGMVGGQYMDVTATRALPAGELAVLHRRKTGRLLAACVNVAVALARPPAALGRACAVYGEAVGLLFQIVDDILDVEGSAEELGKEPGADARLGKLSYVAAHGLDGARELAARQQATAHAALDPLRSGGAPADGVDALAAIVDFIAGRSS